MKKLLVIATLTLGCSFATLSTASAQSASFTFNDGVGTGNAGTYAPGSSFTFSIALNFTPGGAINNLEGVSYWFETSNPTPPFFFGVTLRNETGSMFTFMQTPGLTYPQNLIPSNADDLGGALPGIIGVGAGNYFIANLTIAINPATPAGVYQIENVTSGGKRAVMVNDQGMSLAIPQANYTITVVPEPTTLALAGLGLVGLTAAALRRRAARR